MEENVDKEFRNIVTTIPPLTASLYSPAQLMRDFLSRTNMSDVLISEELTSATPADQTISAELVGSWSKHNKPISVRSRGPFRKFLQHVCHHKVAKQWDEAFVNCWARYEAENGNDRPLFTAHHQFIKERYEQPVIGETFPLSCIYVPVKILAKGVKDRTEVDITALDEAFLRDFAIQGRQPPNSADRDVDWLFITGGPGSGKSALAIRLAQQLARERTGFTLFFRGTRLGGETYTPGVTAPKKVDDTIDIKHYFEAFKRTTEPHLTIIVDGLDEIGARSYAERRVLEVLAEIKSEIALTQPFGKTVRVLVFGRDLVTKLAADAFERQSVTFEMGDFSGSFYDVTGEHIIYGEDLRQTWWQKYVSAKGFEPIDAFPRYLDDPVESLFDLSKEPLLSFLIAKSAWPTKSAEITDLANIIKNIDLHTSNKNRNEIYEDIIERVRRGDDWGKETGPPLRQVDFIDVLQHMAVATWHNGSLRAVSLTGIRDIIQESDAALLSKFERLQYDLGDNGDPTLLTSFYYRFQRQPFSQGLIGDPGDYEIEFTHKTFAEYLLTTFLFDEFERLLIAHEPGTSDTTRTAAQRRWISFVMAGPQQREVGRFASDEAVLRLDKYDWCVWNRAKDVSMLTQCLVHLESSSKNSWFAQVTSLERLQRASGAIMLFWGALNRARFDKTGDLLEIDGEANAFEGIDFQTATPPYTLNISSNAVSGDPTPDTFSVHALSGISWTDGEIPGYYASGGDIRGSHLTSCIIEGGVWSSVSLEDIRFVSSNLRRSRFTLCPMTDCHFEDTNSENSILKDALVSKTDFVSHEFGQSTFYGMRFVSCNFTDAQFERCDFNSCEFVDCKFQDCSFDQSAFTAVTLRHCAFTECSFDNAVFEAETVEACSGLDIE